MPEWSRKDVSQVILDFLEGTGARWAWDDFVSVPIRDPELERVRRTAAALPDRFPPGLAGGYCGDEGLDILRRLAEELAGHSESDGGKYGSE
jgi:hypothetical protein